MLIGFLNKWPRFLKTKIIKPRQLVITIRIYIDKILITQYKYEHVNRQINLMLETNRNQEKRSEEKTKHTKKKSVWQERAIIVVGKFKLVITAKG